MYRLTTEKFIENAIRVHGERYLYCNVEYINARSPVVIACHKHGNFTQKANSHLNGCGCPKCGLEVWAERSAARKRTVEEFVSKAIYVHGDVYDYSNVNYTGSQDKVLIVCKIHGGFYMRPSFHVLGQGCPECGRLSENRKCTTDKFIEKAHKLHKDVYDYSKVKYVDWHSKVIISCRKHGDWAQSPSRHLSGFGCPKCSYNNNISKIANLWLDSIGIPDDKEHREVRKLIHGRRFVTDGYMPETNTVYEFYGDRIHGNLKIYGSAMISPIGKSYGELYQITKDRELVFTNAGYNLVTIWESEFRSKYWYV